MGAAPHRECLGPGGGNTRLLDSRRGAGWHLGCSHLPATCLISGPGGIHREVSPTAQSPTQRTEGVSGQKLQPLPTRNEKPKESAAFGWGGGGSEPLTSRWSPQELVSKLLHLHFKDDKTRVGGDALLLMAELLKIFVSEAAIRSVRQAQAEDLARVDVEQLEKVLPQLLLDF